MSIQFNDDGTFITNAAKFEQIQVTSAKHAHTRAFLAQGNPRDADIKDLWNFIQKTVDGEISLDIVPRYLQPTQLLNDHRLSFVRLGFLIE